MSCVKKMAVVAVAPNDRINVIFAGHDHIYERNMRNGVAYVVTGGGGAPTYDMYKENPYSTVFYSGLHYCVVDIDGDSASVLVKDPEGKLLDKFDL